MSHDYIALEWVKGEIEETLQQAQQALEAYVENTQDRTRLKFCLSYLHQVHGTLQMVEFYGAALLAEEMEALAKVLVEGDVANEADVLEVLMQAILQLPSYLEHIKVGRRDLPVVLLPILNELRAARGESLMSETALFAPSIKIPAALSADELNKFNDPGFAPWLKKLRQMQQTAILHILRGEQEALAIDYLHKVFSRLHRSLGNTPQGLVWLPALAFVEYLKAEDSIPKSAKPLLRQLDAQLKNTQDFGIEVLNTPVPAELLKNLLYYIAKSPLDSGAVETVKTAFNLAAALPSEQELKTQRDALSGPDKKTVGSVVGALVEEITGLKERFDILVRGDDDREEALASLMPIFKQIIDTMGMLGLGMPRRVLQDQQSIVAQLIDQGSASDSDLMDTAGALLYVEATLNGMQQEGTLVESSPETVSVTNAHKAVLHETRNVLEQVKDAVVEYIAKQWDAAELEEVPHWLRSIEGSINMIPLPRVAKILEGVADFVEQQLITQGLKAQWSVMDNFADILTSVEYYIERYSNSPQEADENLLQRAEVALSNLSSQQAEVPVDEETAESCGEETDDFGAVLDSIDLTADDSFNTEVDLATILQGIAEPVDSEPELVAVVDVEEDALEHVAELSVEKIIFEEPAVTEESEEDDLIDDEIIEIFLEEAEEVLETLQEFWPEYRADNANSEAQSTVRRAFHTLKGSGRMVKAGVIGELAWSIENMLNRVIEQTITLGDNACALIDQVIVHIPELIENFRTRSTVSIDTTALMNYAEALSQGERVNDFDTAFSLQNSVIELKNSDVEPVEDVDLVEELELTELVVTEEPEENLIDDALLEIFSAEVATHLEAVSEFIEESQATDFNNELSDQLQRALHTLKGSAHMAGITPIALVASPLEKLVKELCAYQIKNTPGLVNVLVEGSELIRSGIEQLETNPTASLLNETDFLIKVAELEQLLLAPISFESREQALPDPEQLSQFLTQRMDVLLDADDIVKQWASNPEEVVALTQLSDELVQLIDSADKAEISEVSELAATLYELYQEILESSAKLDVSMLEDCLLSAHESLLSMMDYLAAGQSVSADNEMLARVKNTILALSNTTIDQEPLDLESELLEEEALAVDNIQEDQELDETLEVLPEVKLEEIDDDIDAELLEIFLEEAQEIMEAAGVALQRWQADPDNLRDVAELQRELHTLKGGARMAEMADVADLCHELESIYEGLHDGRVQSRDGLIPLLSSYHDILDDMLEHIRNGQVFELDPQVIVKIHAVAKGADPLAVNNSTEMDASASADIVADMQSLSKEVPSNNYVNNDVISLDIDESDREILEIFLEEAQELQQELDAILQEWQLTPDNLRATEEVQRIMHTLKGGARMGGLAEVGDLAHDFEAWMVKAQQGEVEVDDAFFGEVFQRQDGLAASVDAVARSLSQPQSNQLIEADIEFENPISAQTDVLVEVDDVVDAERLAETNVVPFKRNDVDATEVTESANLPVVKPLTQLDQEATDKPQQGRRGPQEMVKVSSNLLDNLVNLAGETSISRGRLEQQVTDFSYSLEEMDSTLDRLRDQLRRLDIETQAQVLFRQERQTPSYDDFDPLEMDRYSQMQQLARSLVESASDLLDIRESLTNKTRDAETLLLQQSRVNTELQEGLMQTRMVPFQRLVPRLRRIVRQVGQELDKQVEFKVFNADGEMDRSILERLISPLEHMLRNAVDHGIENKLERAKTAKSAQGSVELSISREGGDVLVILKDDGHGIDIDAVRKKALERGLITKDSKLTDIEIMQFILHAGFSTAQQVTQISGRGVGMDVVNSEIKQMGGTLFINSIPGQGTEFQVRLPFTVSVNRALMVKVGDDLYAVPLDSIQGIVRVSTHQLEALYQQPLGERTFEYGGADHRLEYLGTMLGTDAQPKLVGQKMPTPVLLIKGETPYALQVDTLLGSREIVVKTLGTQFSSVMGVSGGTILGDGSVVIILDLPAMIRSQSNVEYQRAMALDAIEAEKRHELEVRTKRILVVDDSVTVRKVTTRLLERNGFEVFTAKDGVDAIATLQDHIPDLMLLDIEMPRMDGFEVASIVRHDSRLKHLPIIMITSRTGDKHRSRAFSIGVNEYLGKPFQEDNLLENIEKLLAGDAEN
ncbi:Sensor histidine kinase/response regulator [Oleispira antarctica RB-8]|uniref:Chemotaxis protein CheA n=1 Tax=Oleispira antarctica RB-8 TaxID=698738 RepID=R4YJK5_OLEAN|nr:Sensor histidine kinase/response regulator [Oleispira antarctica RB-8]